MNYLKNLLLVATSTMSLTINAQIGGNQVYGNSNYNNNYNIGYNNNSIQKKTVFSTDSTLTITTHILMNKEADNYLLTVGVNQESKTVIECNTKINQRIKNLKKDLLLLKVLEEHLYIDFISQTKIYDYEVNEKESKQMQTGFEIKKNIVIQLDDIDKIDQLIEMCAKQEIYDIIKVEYVDNDINQSYEEMYNHALSFIDSRKRMYMKSNSKKLNGEMSIVGDNFYSVYPKTQYKKYEAFESSSLSVHTNNYSSHYIRQEARKNKTFYYDGVQVSGFDKIINSKTPKIGIQYIMSLTMVFELEK